jgi:hypothetical protein
VGVRDDELGDAACGAGGSEYGEYCMDGGAVGELRCLEDEQG